MAKIATLVDDFSSQNSSVWTGWSSGVLVSGGQLVVNNTWSWLSTTATWDLTSSSVAVKVVTVGRVRIMTASNDYLMMTVSGGSLFTQVWIGGTLSGGNNFAYDAVAHLWWRFRESGGTYYFDTAPDGATWTNRYSSTLTPVGSYTAATYSLGSGGTGGMTYDNVNSFTSNWPGTGTAALDSLVAAGTGVVTVTGTAAAAVDSLVGAGTGVITVTGTAAAAVDSLVGAGTGVVTVTGTAAAALDSAHATATAVTTVTGTGAATLSGLVAAGIAAGLKTGTGAAPLGGLSAAATGVTAVTGIFTAVLGGVHGTANALPLGATYASRFVILPTRRGGGMIRQSALSTEYLRYSVAATVSGNPYDPTGDVVQFAFLALGVQPGSGDWVAGSWETATQYGQTQYFARCLVGPTGGGHTLATGDYIIWLKVTDSPEAPVRTVGNLTIT